MIAASFLFEKNRGVDLDHYALDMIKNHKLENSNVENVANEIISLISSGSLTEQDRATAYFALGKRYDSKLKSYFQNQLKAEIDNDSDSIYQLLICLDNLGEPVFGADRNGSYSEFDRELNSRNAKQYIERYI